MLSCRRLGQLFELAKSHPHYFLHNYRKELVNAGYEEVIEPTAKPVKVASPTGHGKKVLSGGSLIKAKGDYRNQANEQFAKTYGEGGDKYDPGKGLKDDAESNRPG